MSFYENDNIIDFDIDNSKNINFNEIFNIDRFNMYYLDEIIDIVFDIKDFFSNMPYFLCYLNTQELINLFVLCDNNNNKYDEFNELIPINKHNFNIFHKEFSHEIKLTYDIINVFLKKFHCNCNYELWSIFCFNHTDFNCL